MNPSSLWSALPSDGMEIDSWKCGADNVDTEERRKYTCFLIGSCLFLAGVLAWLTWAPDRDARWVAVSSAPPLPGKSLPAELDARPDPTRLAMVWQRPLFSPTRKPLPATTLQQDPRIDFADLELTGVIMAPGFQLAMLTRHGDGHVFRLQTGRYLGQSHWKMNALEPRSAEFVNGALHMDLKLHVSGMAHAAGTSKGGANPVDSEFHDSQEPAVAYALRNESRKRIESLRQRIEQSRRRQMQMH